MSYYGAVTDAAVRRLEEELHERTAAANGIVENAQNAERDLKEHEKETLGEIRTRIIEVRSQIETLEGVASESSKATDRLRLLQDAASTANRKQLNGVEYRSAGEWALDSYRAALGNRDSRERLEVFYRAADHQTTPDNLGIVPDPIIGNVINFIDAARPIVSFLGPQAMPSATWHRPIVTQHASVSTQGSTGGSSEEKVELVSQKMLITRLTANAVTYGGYVNVSRQNIDFSSPQVLDLIINDLAAQYAIQTELAIGAELAATNTSAVAYGAAGDETAATLAAAVWEAAATAYTATKGQGRLMLAIAPDRLALFGPLFAPVNPRDAQSPGFTAGMFGQGQMGTIAGVPVVMSAGLANGEAFVFSTSAVEVFEQRVGMLQVTEPSVLGVQVAYAGYFTALTIEDDAIIPLTATS
jgi:HK97 family phage major capsid protein